MDNKYFDLLPIQHQTSVNRNFFESTVEQLFAKANIEDINGYIGKLIPDVDNNTNTVFVEQPAPNRDYYNLEPTVTTINKGTGKADNFVFYEDFIFNHRSKGGLVGNHDRIFKTEQYNFAPPIDLDKFINYQNYYWYSSGPEPIQVLGNASVSVVIDNIVGQKTYTSPNNIQLKSGMVVQFTGSFVSGTNYNVGQSYIVEGVGRSISFEDVPTANTSVSAYGEFQTQPYDGNAVPNATSTGSYSVNDPDGASVLANILALANTNINTATFDFDIARPVDLTSNSSNAQILTATFSGDYGQGLFNGNHVRLNVFDGSNKVKSSTSGTAYGFVGAYLTLADGSKPSTTLNIASTFSNAGGNHATDPSVFTNKLYVGSTTNIQTGVGVDHPEAGQVTVTTVNADHVVLSSNISIYPTSNTSISFENQIPKFSINSGSGTKTITLDSGTAGSVLKSIDLNTYTGVSDSAVIVSPLDLMDAINDVGIANLSVVATTNSIEILEANGNAVTISNVTSDARGNPFVGSSITSGFQASTPAIEKANIENQTFAISNKTSTSFDVHLSGSNTARLVENNATFINYGGSSLANVQIFSEDKTLTAGANVFFDKTLGSLTAGTVTPVIGTPDTKTFYISTGDTGYGGTQSGGNFTQPRQGKFNVPAYTQFLQANGAVQTAAQALAGFDAANIEVLVADISQTGSLLSYAWDSGSWDNTPIQNVADYMVVERGAKNKNPWSRLNYWYHVDTLREPLKDNVSNFSIPSGAIRATRPIIEFNRDIELYNWGNSFITTVDIVADKPKEELEGLAIGFPINSSSGSEGSTIIFPNNEADVAKKIYRISDNSGKIQFNDVTSLSANVVVGGHVFSTGGANAGKDYFWNGNRWQPAQQKTKLQQAPLFTLYDDEGVKVDDVAKYPNSDFTGCPVFAYNTNDTTGTYDNVIKANVVYQSGKFSSEPTFHNHIEHHVVTYKTTPTANAVTVPGYLYFKDLNQDYEGRDNPTLRNNWQPVQLPTNYRNFSNVATYYADEIVKYENNYFVTKSNLTANNFNIANFDFYEDKFPVTSKQYVEDVIRITDVTAKSNVFITSAVPYNNDIIVHLNSKELILGTDFSIVTNSQGIKLSNVSLKKGDVLYIKTYTKQDRLTNIDAYGFFEIPENLKFNPRNEAINNIAFSDMLGHFHTIISNQDGFTGSISGVNNFKDTAKNIGITQSEIGQTADDIITPMYLSKSGSREFLNSLRFANNEYVKFKNKFISSSETYLKNNDYLSQTNLEIIDTVLKTIKGSKISKDAHKLTYMAPIGSNFTSTSLTISNASVVDYTFSNTANVALDTTLYVITHNGNVLCSEKDFRVDSTLPLDIKIDSSITLAKNDTLELRIYEDSEPALIPASLSKLGMYPAYEPMFMTDTSYQTDLDVIRCHDGSFVPRQGDKIDNIILDFETLIYNNITTEYRKADTVDEFDFVSHVKPSKYCSSDYSWHEVNDLLENNFNKWVRATGVDWRNNSNFIASNKFTWNYDSDFKNPGHWRGIFDYYYDTQTPNTTPWEMFGFVKKPSWWDAQYPNAITSSYSAFWNNVGTGYIPAGNKKGYHKRWARPSVAIPVNSSGELLSPQDIMFTSTQASDIEVRNNWKFGDGSPAEYAWKKSSYYPFAVAEAMYLSRPALFFSTYLDKNDKVRFSASAEQVVSRSTRKRKGFTDFTPHGFTDTNGNITIKFGITTLVDSFLKFQSLSTNTELADPMRTVDTRLGHKFGGFVNDKNLKVFSDSLSVDGFSAGQRIPSEDVITALHTSNYNSRNFYTGVKITKTTSGFSVVGYDTVSQVFDIIPSDKAGPVQGVAEGGTPANFSIFDSEVSYPKNSFVKLGNTYYQAKEDVIAGSFNTNDWLRLAELPTEGGAQATYYQRGLNSTAKVPYNKQYDNVAEVFDLLISIGRHQKSMGYDFGEFDSSIGDVNDWLLAGRRFLFWSTEDHDANDSITLSPMASTLKFQSVSGKIAEVKNTVNEQYALVDSNGNLISVKECSILRKDNTIEITSPSDKPVFGCVLHTELVEHAVTFNNRTAFNDLIYNNVLGVRQDRLEVKTQRSKDWDGRYSAQGLLITSNGGVLPNFDLLVDSIRTYHENGIDTIDPIKTDLARGLIGFDKSTSLANIKLSDSAQFDFYKGTIRNKGTANSITSILRSNVVNTNKDIEISEEWAIKRGEFGDVFNHQSMDLNIKQSDFTSDNQQVEILYPEDITGTVSNIFVYERNTTYFKTPSIEIDPPVGGGNAAVATAKLYANALLDSVTVTNGGDGYSAKPNVAVITGNIVVARIDEVLQYGLAFSSADVDVPLTGTSAISNLTIQDYTTTSNTTVDVDLANARTLEHAVTQINKQLSLANVTDVVAFSDLDSDLEKLTISSATGGTPVTLNVGSVHGFNKPTVGRANGTVLSFTSANQGVVTFNASGIQPSTYSNGDRVLFQGFTASGWTSLNNTSFYLKSTGTDRQYEVYTDKLLTTGANTSTYAAFSDTVTVSGDANVDYIKVAGLSSGGISDGDYYVNYDPTRSSNPHSTTQFELFSDPSLKVPVSNSSSLSGLTGTIEVYGSGGDKRLYIRGSDFQLSESTLPGGNPSTTLSVLNMTAGRYQPQQRFAIQTANNTTTSDIIVTIGGTAVTNTFFTFDNGNRSINLLEASQLNSKLTTDSFTVDLTGDSNMLADNVAELDGQYPYIEFYLDGKEIKNSPNYRAVTVSQPTASLTRVLFSNVSQYANNISIGANVTISEMGTVQFANTLTTDTPGSKLSIKSVANDTLIANTTSKRTYKVIKDDPTDNRITIDIDDTEQMLKRPTNTIDKGIWPTTSNTTFSIPNAGYVNRANVEWEAFDIQNFASTIGSGRTSNPNVDQHVHFGKAENEDWNVYRLNLHGSQNIDGTMIPAKNFVDTVAGQTMLFSNNPLSVYYDGNSINDSENTRYFDNHIIVKNADLSNIVLKWSNEQLVATPRTVYTGEYVPLRRINRKIKSIAPGGSGNISAALPNTSETYERKIFGTLQVPLGNVEYFRKAGVTRDRRLASVTNRVQITVDNIEGLEENRTFDTDSPDTVRFFGSGATAANLTVGKAYEVYEVAPPDPENNGAGTFYITEANITNTSFADITTGNCYVGFESTLRRDTESKIIGITPGSNTVVLKATDVTDLTNGTNVALLADRTLSSVDTIPSNFYPASSVNTSAKTYAVSSSTFTFHTASVARTGYNQLNFATTGNADGQGSTFIINAGTDDKVETGDFVHFVSGTNYAGNIYPIQSVTTSGVATFFDSGVTSNSGSQNAIVYKGEITSIQGNLDKVYANGTLQISNFDTSKIGAYGYGNIRYANSNTSLAGQQGDVIGLTNTKRVLSKTNVANTINVPGPAFRPLTTSFLADITRNTNTNTADVRIREDVTGGDVKRLLFDTSRQTTRSQDILANAEINYGSLGGVKIADWNSKYQGKPMYVGALAGNNKISFEDIFRETPESFRKIDSVEAELEFRYINPSDLEVLKQLTSNTSVPSPGTIPFDFEPGDNIFGEPDFRTGGKRNVPIQSANFRPFDKSVDVDWWVDNYTKPFINPSLDGFSMTLSVLNEANANTSRAQSSKLDLWPRYIGEHNSYNYSSQISRFITVDNVEGKYNNKPIVKFKFSDKGVGQEGLEYHRRNINKASTTDINGVQFKVHGTQIEKVGTKLKSQKNGNTFDLLPSHPSATSNAMEWWSNNVKSTLRQDDLNRFRIEFGYEQGVTTYPASIDTSVLIPIVIVRSLKVNYTLAPVTTLKLDNLRLQMTGGNISGVIDKKIESVDSTFLSVDNSDNKIPNDESAGSVRTVIYRIDEENNKQILVNDIGSRLKKSEPSKGGYSSMLFSTSDSNSSLNTGTVFGYVPDKPEHMTSAGSMMIGIPNSSTTSITQLLGSSLNASINYIPINFGGSSSKEFSQVNVSVDAHTFKNESKIFADTEALGNSDVVNINDTVNSPGGIEGQHNISNVQTTYFTINKGSANSIINTAVAVGSASTIQIMANNSINQTLLTINKPNHQLVEGSTVIFSTGNASDYLNNTSFIVKDVSSNTFKIAVANTSVIPTSNITSLQYAASFAGGNISTQYNVTGTSVTHLACYNDNNIFEPGDNITFYAGSVDTASLNGTTAEVVNSSGGSIGVALGSRPTALTSNLTIRYTSDANLNVIDLPAKYTINNLYARIYEKDNIWTTGFTGYKEANMSTYDSTNQVNRQFAEFTGFLGNTIPKDQRYLTLTCYDATDFKSENHGIGKRTVSATVLSTTNANSEGLVNVEVDNGGIGFLSRGKLKFSNSINGHVLSGNEFDIIDFVNIIDDDGDQGEQYYTIKAPGATATSNKEFSVSYTAYSYNKDRALRFIRNGQYSGFVVPVALNEDTITVETPYLGPLTTNDGFWVNDILLVEGTSDLRSEMKLRPRLDSMIIRGCSQRNLNSKYRMAPQHFVNVSPELSGQTFGDANTIPIFGFANSMKKLDLRDENVSYSLDGWNSVKVNGAKTTLVRSGTIQQVSDSLNFANDIKAGSIRGTGSIKLSFLFANRDHAVDNKNNPAYNSKFVSVPKDPTNLLVAYKPTAESVAGNALKGGVPKFIDQLPKKPVDNFSPQQINGQYIHDLQNLESIVNRGVKASKLTKIGSGGVNAPALDIYAAKNPTVMEHTHNADNAHLNPNLRTTTYAVPDWQLGPLKDGKRTFTSTPTTITLPNMDADDLDKINGNSGGGSYSGGYETPVDPPPGETPPPDDSTPPETQPDCGSFKMTLYDINNSGEAQHESDFDATLLAIVNQYYQDLGTNYTDGQRAGNLWYQAFQTFKDAGGTYNQWTQYIAYINGHMATSEQKVAYNSAIIDLCDLEPGYVKTINGNLCTNSGEVMFLGNQRINLQDNCDPCALADGINSQNSDYRAICGEPSKEQVNCVIPGGGQAWGETAFGDVIDSFSGKRLIEESIRWHGKKIKVKGDNTKYLTDCFAEGIANRHEPLRLEIPAKKQGTPGFGALVEQILTDRGIDPVEGGYKSIVLRLYASSEKKGDIVDKRIIGSGTGTQPIWFDIRKYGRDTCNWSDVNWNDMKSKGGQGLNLGGAEIRFKGWKPGCSFYKAELQLSKHTTYSQPGIYQTLKQMNYDLTRDGRNYHKSQFGQNLVLGLLVKGTVFSQGGPSDFLKFEDYTNEETGWKYKKIVGYGGKMGKPNKGNEKDRTYPEGGSGYWMQSLWPWHPVQQRRKAGCFNDIDIPVLQAVKIKSAVPFSLGLGCARSPFSEVGDFMPYMEKTTRASANLELGASLTNEELQNKSLGGGFTAPKVLTTKATGGAIQLAEAVGVPSQSNPFMTADYLRVDGLALTPRSGEGRTLAAGQPDANANIAFNPGDVTDSTGFNYRIGDKLTLVGGQPKSIDNSAYYLDKIEITNPGHSYTPADTRFEVFAVTGDSTEVKLPGVALRGVFSPNTANLEPTTKVIGQSASAYYHSFYREYIEQGGGTDKDWINENTIPNYIDSYTSSIESIDVEFKRSDIALDGTSATDSFKITSRSDLIDASREYRAFIGTRDFENAGSMMMFGLGIHDNTEYGEDLIKNSKVYDSFTQDELNALSGSWLCVWDVPAGSVFPNGHNVYANFQAMTENRKGLLKVFYDASVYDSDTSNEYQHFLSRNITRFNGRIVKFLRASNNRIYFKVETTLGLEKEPNFQAYGIPDFVNLWSRFYPIESLSNYQTDTTKSRDYQGRTNAYNLSVEIDSANSSAITTVGSNGFRFNSSNSEDEQYATVKITANRPNTTEEISPIDQQWDIFIIQKDINSGYLRMPFTVHLPDELVTIEETDDGEPIRTVEPVTAAQLAKAMNKIHYNTVYRPVSTPYIKMGESEAVTFRFDFQNIPDDAIIQNIDIDFIMRSTLPGDYGMIWLQAPDGTRLPLMQFLGKFGAGGTNDQGGFMPGFDYSRVTTGADEMIFTVSSKDDAQPVGANGGNLHSYTSKVRPHIGNWQRQSSNFGKDLNGNIYGSDYDSSQGAQLTANTGAYWNEQNNILKQWINNKVPKMKGTWYIEVTRPGRVFGLVNDSNVLARRPSGQENVGVTDYTTAVRTPNIKISYVSPSSDPSYRSANKDAITKVEVLQKGGFQAEFAMRNWQVRAIGSGSGFKARAILSKGELLAGEDSSMIEESAEFQVTEINTSGSITKLRVLNRGVYEQFPSEQERGVPLKYTDSSEADSRLEGPGFGARVLLTSRSVIDCRQPPAIVLENAGPADPETAVEALADAINVALGPEGGLEAEVIDVNPDTQALVLTSDGDGVEFDDVVPGTLDAIGIPPGEYSLNAIGFRSQIGSPGSDFGLGDGNNTGDNPFNRTGDGDSLLMFGATVPPEFEGLTSSAFGNIYRYDLSNVDDTDVLNDGLQSDVDVLYFKSKRFSTPFTIGDPGGKIWVDNYDATGWAHVEDGVVKLRQDSLIDSKKLKNTLIYEKDNGERVTDLILHDPFKGFIVPEAERNISYISDGDPVYYANDGSNFSKHNVGELWWNTSSMRVRWYEQADNNYRAKYWGSYIRGSKYEVFEWIESNDIPGEYTGKGTPLSLENYLVDQVFNKKTNTYNNKYYYWVQGIDSVPVGISHRTISAKQVARLIESPKQEQVPTYGVLSKNTMVLNNAKKYLTDDNSALQINFARKDTKYDNKHESYILLGENSELSAVPSDLINKFIDSISGEDSQGNDVPDKNLNKYETYGIKIRPRQTMFMKIREARRELRTFLNREIGKIILTGDKYKSWNSGVATSNLYEITDWLKTGYVSTNIKPRLNVKSYKDMLALTNVEDGVFVEIIGTIGPNRIYEYDSTTDTYTLVKVVNGTIKIKDEFYTSAQTSLVAIEIRQLLRGIIDKVFVDTNLTNKMYFAMLNYILTEQYQTEWFFKSSYFNIRQSADNLEQKATTKIDPFGDMSDYIKTVKPYTSKLRDFNDRLSNTEIINSFASDFDKPPYQPNLSVQARILDPGVSADANIMSNNNEYKHWANTYLSVPAKIRTFKEKIYIDRNQSNIMALGNASVSNSLANAYSQPTSLTAEARMNQLLNDSANATPINHIERLFVYHPTIKDLNTKIANTSFSADVITGLKATRLTTLRVLAYANFQGEELDGNLFSKSYYDAVGNEILATQFGFDQSAFDSEGYDTDVVVNNYLSNSSLDSELVRDAVTYAGFDSNTFFIGFDGPERPPEHVMLHALEGVQFNVQSGSQGANANVSYKIFLGLNGTVEYTRIASDFSTTLAQPITKTSQEIYVTDATKITNPYSGSKDSVIYVGDERITYSGVDGTRLYGIKRGTLGTSIEAHSAGTKVIDASEQNRFEIGSLEFGAGFDPETSIWNSTNTALADSNTIIAQFLRDKPGSYFS